MPNTSTAFFLLFVAMCHGFPVSELTVSNATFAKLSDPSVAQAAKDQLATASVLPKLRIFFNKTAHAIEIQTSDVSIADSLPDQTVDNDCHHEVTAKNTKLDGTILHDSSLMFGVSKLTWKTVDVFVDARLDSMLTINGDVKVELGEKVFHHCEHLGSKTVGINVVSHGVTGLGVNFTASNAKIVKAPNGTGYELEFNFDANAVGLVVSWNVQEVTANNCKIKILGIDILSYCGIIEKAIKNGVNKLAARAIKVEVPKVAAKVEKALNTVIGGVVRIPLKKL